MVGSLINNKNINNLYSFFKSRKQNQLAPVAESHWSSFVKLLLTQNNNEQFKYLDLNQLLTQNFSYIPYQNFNEYKINKIALPIKARRLIFIDGYLQKQISDISNKFIVNNIAAPKASHLPAPIYPEAFLHLTESLVEQITHINLSNNQPNNLLYLLYLTSGHYGKMNMINYRIHLQLSKNTKAQIIEHYVSINHIKHFTGSRFTAELSDNAQLIYTKLVHENNNSYHFAHNDIILNHKSEVTMNNFFLGAKTLRNNTSVIFRNDQAKLFINSLSIPKRNKFYDINTYVQHDTSNCISRQLHKTITCNQAKSGFNGTIKVSQNALKTDSKMLNNNLLLGKLAQVYSIPKLEIYADDVKCSHGATIGHIEYEQIFYLCTRGINIMNAIKIIIHAFSESMVSILPNNLIQKSIMNIIEDLIRGDKYAF